MMRIQIVSVEGLMGTGKSSSLSHSVWDELVSSPQLAIRFVLEPVEKFCKYGKYNPLQLYYEDPEKNIVATQLHIMRMVVEHYVENIKDAQSEAVRAGKKDLLIICERSPEACLVFLRHHYMRGRLSQFTRQYLYDEWTMLTNNIPLPEYFIKLNASLHTCLKRIRGRGRAGEQHINAARLDELAIAYDEFFNSCEREVVPINITEDMKICDVALRVKEAVEERIHNVEIL